MSAFSLAPLPVKGSVTREFEQEVTFFSRYDRNRNDSVDFRELNSVAIKADRNVTRQNPELKGMLLAKLSAAFSVLDKNGDGRVSRTEYQKAARVDRLPL